MVPTIGGRVRPQAADDARDLGHRRRRRDARPARLRPALRLRDRSPPAAALRVAVPAPDRPRRQPGAARRRDGLRGHPRGPARAAARRGARRSAAAGAAADRPLLRADDRLDRRRPLGPDARRDAGRVGEGGGDDAGAAARRREACRGGWTSRSRSSPWSSRRRCWRSRRSRSSSTPAGRCSTARAGSAATGPSSSSTSCARCARAPTRSGSAPSVLAGDPRVTRVGELPAPLLARRAAQPGQRAARRDGDRRPAADPPGPGRRLHAASAPPARGQARADRLGAGQRPRRDPLGGADRARRLVRRAPLRRRSTCASSPAPPGCWSPATASTGSVSHVPARRGRAPRLPPRRRRAVHRWFNDERVTADLVGSRDSFTLENAAGWVARAMDTSEDRKWAIAIDGDDTRGRLRRPLRPRPPDRAGARGAGRRPGAWGKGVAREAERQACNRAFAEFGAHRIHAEIPATNEAAQKVVTYLGFRCEGVDARRSAAAPRRSTTRSGACCPRTSPGGTSDRGAARRRRRCGVGRRVLPLAAVPRGGGRHPHAANRVRRAHGVGAADRPRDPEAPRIDAISPYGYPGGDVIGPAIGAGAGPGRLVRDRAGQRLRPRAARGRALAGRRARALEGARPRPGARAPGARPARRADARQRPSRLGGRSRSPARPAPPRTATPSRPPTSRRCAAPMPPSATSSPATTSTPCSSFERSWLVAARPRGRARRGGDRRGQRRGPPLLPRRHRRSRPRRLAVQERGRCDARPRRRAGAAAQPRRRRRRRRRARGVQARLRERGAPVLAPTRSSATRTRTTELAGGRDAGGLLPRLPGVAERATSASRRRRAAR